MNTNGKHCLEDLAQRYPQLLVPIQQNARDTELYRDLVLRGHSAPEGLTLEFSMNPNDSLATEQTPAGAAEILFLHERADFEHAVQALAYRCEPREVPASMGAVAINGLVDWGKINAHRLDWLAAGHPLDSWQAEFHAFVSERANIRGAIIILGTGPYSAVPASAADMSEDEWLEKSLTIRRFHELAHFVSRRMFPDNKRILRDEIVADLIGLWAAFGQYDKRLALTFLGLEGPGVREGGRLRNYLSAEEPLEDAERTAREIVDTLADFVHCHANADCFGMLQSIEEQKIAL